MGLEVEACSTLAAVGRKLQLIATRMPRDHRPLYMKVPAQALRPPDVEQFEGEVKWDADRLMLGLRRGQRRAEFEGAVEASLATIELDSETKKVELPWRQFVSAIKQAALPFFEKGQVKADPAYEEARRERELMLEKRRELRLALAGTVDDSEEAGVALQLALRTRRCSNMRREERRRRRACMQEELAEATKQGHFSTVHKLAHALAERFRGPKKRIFNAPRHNNCGVEEWAACLATPAAKGGMGAVIANSLEQIDEQQWEEREELPAPDANQDVLAGRDFSRIMKEVKRASKRKAAPPWSLP
jgi:hypothetical protein